MPEPVEGSKGVEATEPLKKTVIDNLWDMLETSLWERISALKSWKSLGIYILIGLKMVYFIKKRFFEDENEFNELKVFIIENYDKK